LMKWKNKKFRFKLKHRFLSFRRGRRMVRLNEGMSCLKLLFLGAFYTN